MFTRKGVEHQDTQEDILGQYANGKDSGVEAQEFCANSGEAFRFAVLDIQGFLDE